MLQISLLKAFSNQLLHGITQAQDGDFNDQSTGFNETLKHFSQRQQLPIPPKYLQQIHSKIVIQIQSAHEGLKEGDALITNQKNVPLMVKTADCQGVMVYTPDAHALGVIHSGWRGSIQNIIGETIAEMIRQYSCNPEKMIVVIGPSLGPCCAEFTDPKKELPEFCHPFIQGRKVDFWGLSLKQCQEAGIPANQIELATRCTHCQPGYFSHRRGEAQRFITWGMLR